MTGVAVFKVDDIGRRPLLIGGVGGIVSTYFTCLNSLCYGILKLPSRSLFLHNVTRYVPFRVYTDILEDHFLPFLGCSI
jgi:hypothetical protein